MKLSDYVVDFLHKKGIKDDKKLIIFGGDGTIKREKLYR